MTARLQEAGTIRSGDVNLYYRRFGAGAGTPLLIAHGANYYDSADWTGVATNLADAHEVVAWDTRGFGRSDWSPRKDYSWDAQMADIHVLMDRFGWSKAVILGHSFGGAYAMLFAARFPERTAGLVIVADVAALLSASQPKLNAVRSVSTKSPRPYSSAATVDAVFSS